MGGILTSSAPASKIPIPKILNEENYPAGNVDMNQIPDDQFLCPDCERVPEILNIHSDNDHIELKCNYHGIKYMSIGNYYESLKNNIFNYYKTKCFNCGALQKTKENMFIYCYYCKVDFCPKCANDFHQKEKDHRRNHLDVCISVNEKNNKCLEHFNSEITNFCLDCQQNFCDKERTSKHLGHNKISLFTIANIANKYREVIIKKNKILADIIRFNKLILDTYDKFQNNFFHIQSLINVAKSLEEECQRDTRELECMINRLEKSHKEQTKAIENLKEYRIKLTGNEIKVHLRDRNLNDGGFKLISNIQFKQIQELDVSKNNISNIESLNNMNLPHLKYIDMSDNVIKDIKPLAELNSPKLKEICLQHNRITDLTPFCDSNFKDLERLRVEQNNFDKSLDSFKKVLTKYRKQLIYIPYTVEQFNAKYETSISLANEVLKLNHIKKGDELLQDLYLIMKRDNKITELLLDDNLIKDASIISRMPLKNLKLLDLSLNEITNIQFLTEMKLPKLTTIYLNANKINNIFPLIQIKDPKKKNEEDGIGQCFKNLILISLKENNLTEEDDKIQYVLKTLTSNGIELDFDNKYKYK